MYERLILCDYAVADLTTSNANVLYELGIRHAVKPFTTINVYAKGTKLPFDVNGVRCTPYTYNKARGLTNKKKDIEALAKQLKTAKRKKNTDSPVYQLVDGIQFQNSVAHQKTDIFRDQVEYNKQLKKMLEKTRENKTKSSEEKLKDLDQIVQTKIDVENEEAGVLIDVMLSYRALSAFDKMIAFISSMPSHIKNTVMVQEQLGFALNRVNEKEEAIRVLEEVTRQNGPSSETYGIMGRIFKDQYDEALKNAEDLKASAFLNKAIETYRKGFEADWRDAYPGINLLSLLEIKSEEEEVKKLAPVVAYSVERKMASKTPDYWDYATLLELAIMSGSQSKMIENLSKAVACSAEPWMFETTARSLERMIKRKKEKAEDATIAEKAFMTLQDELKRLKKE